MNVLAHCDKCGALLTPDLAHAVHYVGSVMQERDDARRERDDARQQLEGAVANAAVLRDTLMEIRDAVEPGTPIHAAAASALIAYARGQ